MRPAWLSLILLASLARPAYAQCKDTEGTNASLFRNCYKPRLDASNKRLAEEVNQLTKLLEEHRRTKGTIAAEWLRTSQDAWERYRNTFCEVQGIAEVGPQSSRVFVGTDCAINLNNRRMSELRALKKFVSD